MIRLIASWAVWVVAVVVGVVTVPAIWVAEHVAKEDGWVSFAGDFVKDDEFRDGVIDAAAGAALSRSSLPPAAAQVMEDALRDLVRTAVQRPEFVTAWRESLRRTHRLTFRDGASGRLVADIGPLATFVARDVSQQLPVQLTVPDQVLVPIQSNPNPTLIRRVESSPTKSTFGLVLTGILLLTSMVLAGSLAGALRRFGLAFLAVAASLLAITGAVVPRLLGESSGQSPFARQLRDLLVAHATGSIDAWAITIGVVGAVATVAGLAGGLLRAPRSGVSRP